VKQMPPFHELPPLFGTRLCDLKLPLLPPPRSLFFFRRLLCFACPAPPTPFPLTLPPDDPPHPPEWSGGVNTPCLFIVFFSVYSNSSARYLFVTWCIILLGLLPLVFPRSVFVEDSIPTSLSDECGSFFLAWRIALLTLRLF